MTDFYEMRRHYESRKAHLFCNWLDRWTKRLAVAGLIFGAIVVVIMLVKIMGRT